MSQSNNSKENAMQTNGTDETAARSEVDGAKATGAETNSAEAASAEATPKKLTPLEAIKQAQAARNQNMAGGGKRGGNKGQAFGQGGAAASRKPTTGRRSMGSS